jgi:hypothetical protein
MRNTLRVTGRQTRKAFVVLNKTARMWGSGLIVAGLTVGAFNLGLHAGPRPATGHDLLRMAAVPGRAGTPGLALASLGTRVAQGNSSDRSASGETEDEDSAAPGAIFRDVYTLLREKYVDALPTDTQFSHAAAASMLASLQDPASRFLEPSEMMEMADEARGVYHGLGAVTAVREIAHPKTTNTPPYTELRLTIVAPMPGSPADQAGLYPGDYITAINGKQIAGLMDSTWQYDPAVTQFQKLKSLENDPVTYNK